MQQPALALEDQTLQRSCPAVTRSRPPNAPGDQAREEAPDNPPQPLALLAPHTGEPGAPAPEDSPASCVAAGGTAAAACPTAATCVGTAAGCSLEAGQAALVESLPW